MPSELVAIGKKDAADPTAENRIVVAFVNDHDIGGAKFDVRGVSAEQVFVAVAYLSRIANQMLDAAVLASAQGSAQMDAIKRALATERGRD